MPLSPISQVLLSLDKPLQDEIITESGLKFFIDPSYNKNFQATVTGKIAALPIHPRTKKEKEIISQLEVGDEVCFSYQVVSEMVFSSDAHRFISLHDTDDGNLREFKNGMGESIRAYAMHGKISKIWVGVYENGKGQFVNGVQGTQHELERWMSQFQFGKTDEFSFENLIEYDGQDYWKCPLEQIFAKRGKDGHLVAVGDRVICKPVEEEIPAEVRKALNIISDDAKVRYQDRGRVINGGKDKGLKKDMIVSFNPSILEKYDFYDKQYYLVRKDFVLGIWSKN